MASDRVQRSNRAARTERSAAARTSAACADHNEDSLLVAPPLFAVADGMGGTQQAKSPQR